MNDSVMLKEWDQWQVVCKLLETSGACTAADLKAKQGATATPGQRLLTEIVKWGEALAVLRMEAAAPREAK